jgi:hypothetical protein
VSREGVPPLAKLGLCLVVQPAAGSHGVIRLTSPLSTTSGHLGKSNAPSTNSEQSHLLSSCQSRCTAIP